MCPRVPIAFHAFSGRVPKGTDRSRHRVRLHACTYACQSARMLIANPYRIWLKTRALPKLTWKRLPLLSPPRISQTMAQQSLEYATVCGPNPVMIPRDPPMTPSMNTQLVTRVMSPRTAGDAVALLPWGLRQAHGILCERCGRESPDTYVCSGCYAYGHCERLRVAMIEGYGFVKTVLHGPRPKLPGTALSKIGSAGHCACRGSYWPGRTAPWKQPRSSLLWA